MAAGDFLTVASQAIPVEMDGNNPSEDIDHVGAQERAYDGTMRSSIRARKSRWTIRTILTPRTTADTIRTALEGTPPLTATGSLVGTSTSVHVWNVRYTRYKNMVDRTTGTVAQHVVLEFEMREE